MKRIGLMGTGLMTGLVLGALQTAPASAAAWQNNVCGIPQFSTENHFSDAKCEILSTGKYELFVMPYGESELPSLSSPGVLCLKVAKTAKGTYENANCSGEEVKGGEYMPTYAEFTPSSRGTLKDSAVTAQEFGTTAGTVSCASETVTGTTSTTKTRTQVAQVNFGTCEAFGAKASISTAELEFNANQEVSVVGKPIVVTDPTGKCSVKIEEGGGNAGLNTVKYYDFTTKMRLSAQVTKLHYEASGTSACGTAGKAETNGTFKGVSEVELEGGSIMWG